jgi:hypothetical protein
MSDTQTPTAEQKAAYRAALDGTDSPAITTAVIRFPPPIGPHTYSLNDEVAFYDRGQGRAGRITEFERRERDIYVTVDVPEFGMVLVDLRKALFIEHPKAAAMAAPVPRLPMGTVVRAHGLKPGKTYGGIGDGDLAVVIADKGRLVNLARLGSWQDDKGRDGYARLAHDYLTVVTVDARTGTVTD